MAGWGEPHGQVADSLPDATAAMLQQLLEAILGDEPFELAQVAPMLAVLADASSSAPLEPWDRTWTGPEVLDRCQELLDLYNPPPELGGDYWPWRDEVSVDVAERYL